MRKRIIGGFGVAATFIAAGLAGAPAVGSPQAADTPREPGAANHREDHLSHPLADKVTTLKTKAIAGLASGKTKPVERNGSEVAFVGGRWIELKKKNTRVDKFFTVLTEFGDKISPDHGGDAGPIHNQIPAPDAENNSDVWQADFNRAYYDGIVNGKTNSMADYYYKQSGGKHTVSGYVADWAKVEYNEARYGNNADEAGGYWNFVNDSVDAWYNAQVAAGKTQAEIDAQLAEFDVWDRYDIDGDGNFNEPDGYLDHFAAVHAGVGEEAGGGAQGEDAIWSHRWAAFYDGSGPDGIGPEGHKPAGGVRIGNSKIWVLDYMANPENGGLGVFAHEYGHDLGLPDYYDTAGGDNSSAFWTGMSGGSWLSQPGVKNIGSSISYFGPHEKMYLGWLDYVVAKDDNKASNVALGSAGDATGPLPQAVLVELPIQNLTKKYNTPKSGSYEWWSGQADNLRNSLTRDLDLRGATTAKLNANLMYDIEAGYDYLYAQVSTDGGNVWTNLKSKTGKQATWAEEQIDLSAYAGQQIKFRFYYFTDGGVNNPGAFIDDISLVTDATAGGWSDDVEAGTAGWTSAGFTRFTGTSNYQAEHYYLAEFRTYTGYDKVLKSGPYNFGWPTKPDTVEKFPYQDGLLIWYVNTDVKDNNTSQHIGTAEALPIDARPAPIHVPGCTAPVSAGNPTGICKLGNRRQPFDATFGKQSTDPVTFHIGGVAVEVPSAPGIAKFDDTDPNRYWDARNPWHSVKVAGTGTKIEVLFEMSGLLPVMIVKVTN